MVTVKELLDNIAVVCVDNSDTAVFERGKPRRSVPLTELLNILHQYEKNFDGWGLIKT